MKKLLSTTALAVVLGFPTLMFAQTTESAQDKAATAAANEDAGRQDKSMSGFLAERGPSDLFASDLIGQEVHARRAAGETESTDGEGTGNTDNQAAGTTDGIHDMAMMNRADLDGMDNIGQINEIVLSSDGQVLALVIGVGGFLGTGAHDVAVTMDQITFAFDAEDPSQMQVVLNTDSGMLKRAPAYERMSAMKDAEAGGEDTARTTVGTDADGAGTGPGEGNQTGFAAPELEREGYERVEVRDVSTEMLMEKTVYDTNDNDVGTVTDMLLNDDGKITHVIIDFGGFLGMGSNQASLEYKELTILTTKGYADVRIYVDATKEQIQELPRYLASN